MVNDFRNESEAVQKLMSQQSAAYKYFHNTIKYYLPSRY